MPQDVGSENLCHPAFGQSQRRLAARAARVHHQIVNRLVQGQQRLPDRGRIGHVHQDDFEDRFSGRFFERLLGRFGSLLVPAGQIDLVVPVGERQLAGHLLADAGVGPGDERDLTGGEVPLVFRR